MEELITKKELASRMKVCVSTVNNWIRDNRVPYVKLGKAIRFNYEEVLKAFRR